MFEYLESKLMALWADLKVLFQHFSTWVATTGASLVVIWEAMPQAYKDQLSAQYPVLLSIAPGIWLVGFIVAKRAVQPNVPTLPSHE